MVSGCKSVVLGISQVKCEKSEKSEPTESFLGAQVCWSLPHLLLGEGGVHPQQVARATHLHAHLGAILETPMSLSRSTVGGSWCPKRTHVCTGRTCELHTESRDLNHGLIAVR